MDMCGEVVVNCNRFVGHTDAVDHKTVKCIVAVMRCTKGAGVNKTSEQERVADSLQVMH
jgi:hypothetical protein